MTAVDFDLHSLGWKAFQDLCGTVLKEVLGQTVQQFVDSNDGGRDGAFAGIWKRKAHEDFRGNFVLQCKFTAKRDKHLRLSDFIEELEKTRRLAAQGLAKTYLLLTNAALKGVEEERIREAFTGVAGIEHFAAYGRDWISSQIRESSRLRMLVPRVYGLGDLSQILDERAYSQATEILSSLGDDLAKFVITDSYRQSAKALVDHGFVLLLGEPAAGKSTIAAALAVGAIDEWGCSTLKIRNGDDFKEHWNPHEPKQFFWVDDAFGPTQLDWNTTSTWNSIFPHMQAAIRNGAKVVFTSRTHIFNSARQFLKTTAFPLLSESQVVIHVENLTSQEREQILYNHMKLGRQPTGFRSNVKSHLAVVAAHQAFKPETARRLSDPLFTKKLGMTELAIKDFVENLPGHLIEVIQTLDAGSRSALALVFMRGGNLSGRLELSDEEQRAVDLIGGSLASVRESLNALNQTLVQNVIESGADKWRFKHPTIRDAFASVVAADRTLLDIYLKGAPPSRLLDEVSCGDLKIQGVKVVVPSDRYALIIARLDPLDTDRGTLRSRFLRFLARRCDRQFLNDYLAVHPNFISSLKVASYLSVVADVDLIARLHEYGLLPEDERLDVVAAMRELAVETPDSGVFAYRDIFRPDEFEEVLGAIRMDLIPNLGDVIDQWRGNCGEHDDPEEFFQPLIDELKTMREQLFDYTESIDALDTALSEIDSVVDSLRSKRHEPDRDDFYDKDPSSKAPLITRSIFEDVDE